ncbi:MAG: tetratricopeptide repeat protein [Methanothrix sp.]|nr:tetratricopeptide repeat protein [Methanothrix sp.]
MIDLPPSPRLLQLSSYLILSALVLIISASAAPQDNADYWLGEGHSSLENGSYKLAVSCFDRALKIDGGNASAWGGKGIALSRLGRYKMAEMCLSFALKKDDTNPDYWLEDGYGEVRGCQAVLPQCPRPGPGPCRSGWDAQCIAGPMSGLS